MESLGENTRDHIRLLPGIGPRNIYYCFIVNDPMTLEWREAEGHGFVKCPLCNWEEAILEKKETGKENYISASFFAEHAWRCSMNGFGITVADDHRALNIMHGDASVTRLREYSKPPLER